jgi:predicted Zn-dependent protease
LLVRIALELRTYSVATRILAEYIDAQPVNAGLIYTLASLQHLQGQQNEAIETCARALGLQPGHVGATELIRKIDRLRKDFGDNDGIQISVMEDATHDHGRNASPG